MRESSNNETRDFKDVENWNVCSMKYRKWKIRPSGIVIKDSLFISPER